MRTSILATGFLLLAATAVAQTTTTTTTAAPATDTTAPPLIKNVDADPGDSPMVRAAKRAVKARQNPSQRRVVSLTTSTVGTRGRVAYSSGPAEGPKLPPPASDAKTVPPPKVLSAEERAKQHKQEVQTKLRRLAAEESQIGTELDEPYGHDQDEDRVDQRLSEIAAERKKLEESMQTPPPPPPPY